MRIPTIRGMIDRRLLVNYRVDPDVMSAVLPAPFRPQLVNGFAIAGICLIRLRHVRPRGWPASIGISSENAAHRFAVQWDSEGETKSGVYIPLRNTSSILNALAGGRVFPGVHGRAHFDVREAAGEMRIEMESLDGATRLHVVGRTTRDFSRESVFPSLKEASDFFEAGSLGYSPDGDRFDGLELHCFNWQAQPLEIEKVESSVFDDEKVFPKGAIAFDNALWMRGIDHEWHGRQPIRPPAALKPSPSPAP